MCSYSNAFELKGLNFWWQMITGELLEAKVAAANAASAKGARGCGTSRFHFVDFVSNLDKRMCLVDDDLLSVAEKTSSLVEQKRVKCLPYQGNGTLIMIDSVKEMVDLLLPAGNYTKQSRSNAGNCVLVLFYTAKSCPGSALLAPHFNALPRQFPNLKIAAIDAIEYSALNSDFGIIGLPTILLFHQSRAIMKYNETTYSVKNFIKFVHKYTNLVAQSTSQQVFVTSEDFNGPLSNKVVYERDIWLYAAWLFIVFCACFYFSKSRLCAQIVEMIKRTWRESEAQHEHQN